MVKCVRCKKELENTRVTCDFCGARVGDAQVSNRPAPSASVVGGQRPAFPQHTSAQRQQQQQRRKMPPRPPKSSGNGGAVLGIVIAALIGGWMAFGTDLKGWIKVTQWKGTSTLICGKGERLTIGNKTVAVSNGPAFVAGGDCKLTITGSNVLGKVGVVIGEHAQVRLLSTTIRGKEAGVILNGSAKLSAESSRIIGPMAIMAGESSRVDLTQPGTIVEGDIVENGGRVNGRPAAVVEPGTVPAEEVAAAEPPVAPATQPEERSGPAQAEIVEQQRKIRSNLARCSRKYGLEGSYDVTFRISKRGMVTTVDVTDNLPIEARSCVVGAVRNMRFTPWEGDDVTVTYPIIL